MSTTGAGTPAAAEIDARLAALPDDQRMVLQAVRETIAAAVPEAVERIAYDMPSFYYRGKYLVSYAGWKKHCAIYPGTVLSAVLQPGEIAGLDVDKGTIRFTPERPLPAGFAARLVQARARMIDAKS